MQANKPNFGLPQGEQMEMLLPRQSAVLIAVSGGVDSMALLHWMHCHAQAMGWRLYIAHFNHQLRREASDMDEALVRDVARRFGIPIEVGCGNVLALQREMGWSMEMAARKLRHDFFASAAIRHGLSLIATAHHADDQAELILLRLMRGAGPSGFSGMRPSNPSPSDPKITLVRPFLSVPKSMLFDYVKVHEVTFREDDSNRSTVVPRNVLRHDVMPALLRLQPELHKKVGEFSQILQAENDCLDRQVHRWLAAPSFCPFIEMHEALQRRIIVTQLQQMEVQPEFKYVEWLRLHPEEAITINPQLSICRKSTGFLERYHPVPITHCSEVLLMHLNGNEGDTKFNNLYIHWEIRPVTLESVAQFTVPNQVVFDADKVGDSIQLRFWQPGDRFHPIGMHSPVKLQDFFTNLKIDSAKRRRLVVAETASHEIFWIQYLRISQRFKLDKTTQKGLIWHWHC